MKQMKRIVSWALMLCLLAGMGILPQSAAADSTRGVNVINPSKLTPLSRSFAWSEAIRGNLSDSAMACRRA
ncbi:MAG: hypothetical protein Q4D04_09030 [Clostridia bacterium]|nr:hypothetical protein [Clostridia bacterium]